MIFLYALARPIHSDTLAISNASAPSDPTISPCSNIHGCRTMPGILWNCLSVITVCTWVAIHPNVPEVGTHFAVVFYQNFELMAIALLAPELIILWAMRQWFSARIIAKKFQKYGWGKTHAFFILMGGFALYDDDKFCGYLSEKYGEVDKKYWGQIPYSPPSTPPQMNRAEDGGVSTETSVSEPDCLLEHLIANGYITITEDEIRDRSHADIISKFIAVLQTTWFVLQVAARVAEGLAITELEIVTVGFALLNLGIYFLWWNKPLRVRYPVRVTWRQQRCKITSDPEGSESRWSWASSIRKGITAVVGYTVLVDGVEFSLWRLVFFPLFAIAHIIAVCVCLIFDQEVSPKLAKRFPAYLISSRLQYDPLALYIFVYSIACVFGAVHCIPWVFQFPSRTEQVLWRTSGVAVAAAPLALGILHWYVKVLENKTPKWLRYVFNVISFLLPSFYITARISLIFLALIVLRDLPQDAYQAVKWTTFIPHIG